MSRQYPIWNDVENCGYNSSKSYGNRETGKVTVKVGSSQKNSHEFLTHTVTKRERDWNGIPAIVFAFSVDGVVLKKMIFKRNANGAAGELLKTVTKLNKIKGI